MSHATVYKSESGRAEIDALYDRVLDAWPVPCERLRVPTRHGETFVVASGDADAPPLVLLHGAGSNSASWAGDVAAYSQGCRVYAVDRPGEPGKSAPHPFRWGRDAYAAWLGDVLDGLGARRAVLGGISLGGWTAFNYAISRPERVAGLVLLSPAGLHPPRRAFALRALACSLCGHRGLRRLQRAIFAHAPVDADVDRFFALVAKHYRFQTGAPPLFPDEALRRLSMPVLLLAGTRDVMLHGPKTAERLQRLHPAARVRLLEGAGHALLDTAPWVVSFLQENGFFRCSGAPSVANLS